MSTTPRRKKPGSAPRASNSSLLLSGGRKHALVAVALAIFAGVPFLLGKYFELKQPDAFDSGSYVYSAQHVLSGARVGYEEKPSAQAGTLLVNMLGVALTGYNETGSKVLQGLFQAAALAFMFVTIRRLYGTLAAVLSVIVASVYLSAPVIAKSGNVKEQFMIALMVMGMCSFVWYRLTGKWWWALLTGALLIGGPMFKQTGVSAIAAVGLFVLAGPVLYRYAWKKVGQDTLLLVAGAAITLTPICIWYASMGTPVYYWPYSFAVGPVLKLAGVDFRYVADTGKAQESTTPVERKESVEGGTPSTRGQDARDTQGRDALATQHDSLILRLLPGYVSDSWRMLGPAERREALRRVFRYYGVLILPIAVALGAVVARVVVRVRNRRAGPKAMGEDPGRFVLLFGLWWFFDMGFCFISPHSYEQYYLPLNASSAMLGSYFVGLYAHRFQADRDKTRWIVLGLLGLLVMIALSWHIFFGLSRYPHNGGPADGRIKGYVQKWQEVTGDNQYGWAVIGDYIRKNSEPSDPIYVWGWYPGIYVQAQRMSPTPKAFEGMMHTLPPEQLAERVAEILAAFEKNPPKFIVDTRKRHFPWHVPPLELWPQDLRRGKKGFLPAEDKDMKEFDQLYANYLRQKVDATEAVRYEVMQPLRWYVMKNYQVVSDVAGQVLFRRK